MTVSKIKFNFTLISTKILIFLLKNVCKTNATSLPGKFIFKLCPNFLESIGEHCNDKIITITGTNGKTTTSGLIAQILKSDNKLIVNNSEGANMLTGIATAVAKQLPQNKKVDNFVFESDEAYLATLYNSVVADYLVVTNLFRDQLDRYGELDTTAKKIKNAILKNEKLKIILNADDPTLCQLETSANIIRYGFQNIEFMCECEKSLSPSEVATCFCGKDFEYAKRFYSHIGHYNCKCGFKRQVPDYSAFAKIYQTYTDILISTKNVQYNFRVNLPNIYNAYNALAAISLSLEIGIKPEIIQKGLNTYKSAFGRSEKKKINGKNVFTQLIKNPTGATEVLRTISSYSEDSVLLIAINDNYADGRDVSWLWDTDFEILKSYKNKIFISGIRALDMAVRLKYADINMTNIVIESNLKKAYNRALSETPNNGLLLVMPTYTALLALDKMFKTN